MSRSVSLCFVVAIGCFQAAAPALAQTAPPASVEAPSIKVGDSWTFDKTDGLKNVKDSTSVTVVTAVTDSDIRADQTRTDSGAVTKVTRNKNFNLMVMEMANGKAIEDPFYPSFAFPLEIGKTWSGEVTRTRTYESDRKVVAKLTGKVLAWEKITVPAGTFDAMRIEVKGFYNGQNLRGRWSGQTTDTIWYAPAAKAAVKWLFEDVGATSTYKNTELYELVSYKLVP
jgi:hypothetical protein